MRHGVWLWISVAVGCADTSRPMEEVCLDACLEEQAALAASVPEGGTLLNDHEYQYFVEDLVRLREGLQPVPDQPFGVCRGGQACTTVLSPQELLPIARGDYTLGGALKVPPVGQWSVRFHTTCIDAKGGLVAEDERVIPLRGDADGEMALPSLLTFSAPPRGAWAGADRCMFGLLADQPEASPLQLFVTVQFEDPR